MIITSITQPVNAAAGTLWRKEKTGEVRAADGKGGWRKPTDAELSAVGLVRFDEPQTPAPEEKEEEEKKKNDDKKKEDDTPQGGRELTEEEIKFLSEKHRELAETQESDERGKK